MVSVNTVLGPIDTSNMGFTLCHEHVMTGSAGVAASYPELVDKDSIADRAVEDLSRTREGGVSTTCRSDHVRPRQGRQDDQGRGPKKRDANHRRHRYLA